MKETGELGNFWKVYGLVGSTKMLEAKPPSFRTCRFCGRNEDNTTFKTKAHACPELLGQNDFICFEECDECNFKFGAFESHLSKLFIPYLTMVGIRGKRKVPEFHSRTENNDESTRTIIKMGDDGHRQIILGLEEDYIVDKVNLCMSLRFRLPPFRPFYVYKSLVKIGLSILPPSLVDKYKSAFQWLSENEECGSFPFVLVTLLYRKKFAEPSVELYEVNEVFDNNGFYPELTLIVNFGNLIIQIFLPLSCEFDYPRSNRKSPQVEVYPGSIYNQDFPQLPESNPGTKINYNYKFVSIDLGSDLSCLRDEMMHFKFDSIDT
ncbi:MAG: hypothetical protein WC716_11815 [Chitinophagaceae bacterium]|jgi:hypothetical protein